MDTLQKIVGRIERRLKAVGKTAAAASKEAGLSASAIYNLKRGALGKIPTKGGNASTFAALAPVLDTTADWLMTGNGNESPRTVTPHGIPVKGYVGAASEGHFFGVLEADLEEIPAPEINEETTALVVMGDSLGKVFDRWYVVYDKREEEVTADMIGRLCVVGLPGGRIVVKVIKSVGDGYFDLLSQTGTSDILSAEVEWAARVNMMVPR